MTLLDLLTLLPAPPFKRRFLRRNPGHWWLVVRVSGLASQPLPAPKARGGASPSQEMVFSGILTWVGGGTVPAALPGRRGHGGGRAAATWLTPTGLRSPGTPANGLPSAKTYSQCSLQFFTSPDKVQRKKEARAKGIRAGGKNKHTPGTCT